MSRAVNAAVVGIAIFVILAGSIWYFTVAQGTDRISVADFTSAWESADNETSVVRTEVAFRNRYSVDVALQGVRYELTVNDLPVAATVSNESATIRPGQALRRSAALDVPTDFVSEWLRSHIENGERSEARLIGTADFRVGGRHVPLTFGSKPDWRTSLQGSAEQAENCPRPAPEPCVASTIADWQERDGSRVFRIVQQLRNEHAQETTLENLSAELRWNDHVVGRSQFAAPVAVAPGQVVFVEFQLFLEHERLKAWWPSHVENCEVSPVKLVVAFTAGGKRSNATPTPSATVTATPTSTPPPPPSPTPSTSTSSSPPPSPPASSTPTSTTPPPPSSTPPPPPPPPTSTTPPPTSPSQTGGSNGTPPANTSAPANAAPQPVTLRLLSVVEDGGAPGRVQWVFDLQEFRSGFVCPAEGGDGGLPGF